MTNNMTKCEGQLSTKWKVS